MENFKYVLLDKKEKRPLGSLINYKEVSDEEIKQHNGNIGIMLSYSNITVIDVDLYKKETLKFWNNLIKNREIDTLTVNSASGGLHLYFIREPDLLHRQKAFGVDIDIFTGENNFIVAPPSKYCIKGTKKLSSYEYEDETKEIIKMPKWFKDLLLKDQNES